MDEISFGTTFAVLNMLNDKELNNISIYLQELLLNLSKGDPIFKTAINMKLNTLLSPLDDAMLTQLISYLNSTGLETKLVKQYQLMYGGAPNGDEVVEYKPAGPAVEYNPNSINMNAIERLYTQLDNPKKELSFIGIGLKEYASITDENKKEKILKRMTIQGISLGIIDSKAKHLAIESISEDQFSGGISKQQMLAVIDSDIKFLENLKTTANEQRQLTKEDREYALQKQEVESEERQTYRAFSTGMTTGTMFAIVLFFLIRNFIYSTSTLVTETGFATMDITQFIGLAVQQKIKSLTFGIVDLEILKNLPEISKEINKALADNKDKYQQALLNIQEEISLERERLTKEPEQKGISTMFTQPNKDVTLPTTTAALQKAETDLKQSEEKLTTIRQYEHELEFINRKINELKENQSVLDQIKKSEADNMIDWSKLKPELLPECSVEELPGTCDTLDMLTDKSPDQNINEVVLARLLQYRSKLRGKKGNIEASSRSLPAAPWFGTDKHSDKRKSNEVVLTGINSQLAQLNREIEVFSKFVADDIKKDELSKSTTSKQIDKLTKGKPVEQTRKELEETVKKNADSATHVKNTLDKLEQMTKTMEQIEKESTELMAASYEYTESAKALEKLRRETNAKYLGFGQVVEYISSKVANTPLVESQITADAAAKDYLDKSLKYIKNVEELKNSTISAINTENPVEIPILAAAAAINITDNVKLLEELQGAITIENPMSFDEARSIASSKFEASKFSSQARSLLESKKQDYNTIVNAATTTIDGANMIVSSLIGIQIAIFTISALRGSNKSKKGGNKKTRNNRRRHAKTIKKYNKNKNIKKHSNKKRRHVKTTRK